MMLASRQIAQRVAMGCLEKSASPQSHTLMADKMGAGNM